MPTDFICLSYYLPVFFLLFRAKLPQSIACTPGQFPHSTLAHSSLNAVISPWNIYYSSFQQTQDAFQPLSLSFQLHAAPVITPLFPILSSLGCLECHPHPVLLLYVWLFLNLLFKLMILFLITDIRVHHSYILGAILSLWSFSITPYTSLASFNSIFYLQLIYLVGIQCWFSSLLVSFYYLAKENVSLFIRSINRLYQDYSTQYTSNLRTK